MNTAAVAKSRTVGSTSGPVPSATSPTAAAGGPASNDILRSDVRTTFFDGLVSFHKLNTPFTLLHPSLVLSLVLSLFLSHFHSLIPHNPSRYGHLLFHTALLPAVPVLVVGAAAQAAHRQLHVVRVHGAHARRHPDVREDGSYRPFAPTCHPHPSVRRSLIRLGGACPYRQPSFASHEHHEHHASAPHHRRRGDAPRA